LHGHSANNRLTAFAYRPAPIQVTHIGYPFTTGLEAIDYRITDSLADPCDQDPYYTEKLFRLDCGFLCYKPPCEAPEPATGPPAAKNGFVTFGSFNNMPKLGPRIIALWARVLKAVPGSKLLLKTKPFNDCDVRARTEKEFACHGISPGRLILTGHSASLQQHLESYADIDIALDTFPYNGTTTTCEAIWMGVPVVALEGSHHAGRVGLSLLSRLGLKHLVAPSADKYAATAAFLARNINQLAVLRRTLRPAMASSSLCNAPAYAECLKNAYLEMWRARR
jgi:predicted O-linked N-acetylglucosamine transferase (SPINDLY family)